MIDDWTTSGIIPVEDIFGDLDGMVPIDTEFPDKIIEEAFNAEPLIGIIRHRLETDGAGVTTLVGFHGCPLSCSYCLNPQCNIENGFSRWITPESLFEELLKDDLYFRTTGGGVTFGGGEPLLRDSFIKKFAEIVNGYTFSHNPAYIQEKWRISIETSLNVPIEKLMNIADVVDEFIVDIKDMNPEIYESYTKWDNTQVIDNLRWLIDNGYTETIHIRVPFIPGYNNAEDVEASLEKLKELGLNKIEKFQYIIGEKSNSGVPYTATNGKVICAALKDIRIAYAKINNIDYQPAICHYEGECSGTCPKCEEEVKELTCPFQLR